jgi:uncharacterized membrane protein
MSELSTGWIVAIVLGSILVAVLIIILCVWLFVWRKKMDTSVMDESKGKDMQKQKYNHDKWDELLKSIERHQQKEVRSEVM